MSVFVYIVCFSTGIIVDNILCNGFMRRYYEFIVRYIRIKWQKHDELETMNIGIVGFGEIGKAIYSIYQNTGNLNLKLLIQDPYENKNDNLSECELLNVCIPYSSYDQFKQCIIEFANYNQIKQTCIIIIHSTVQMGTINKLQNESKLKHHIFISSPVRGVHPNLIDGLYTFEKYIGISEKYYNNKNVIQQMKNHMNILGMKSFICRSNEAELAKVISTTLYGLSIAATEDIGQLCDCHNLSFDNVFTNWQIGYNFGYKILNKYNVQRPVLYRIPNKEKIIGGHCVLPNCVILNNIGPQNITNHITQFILRYSNCHSRKHHIPMPKTIITKEK